MEILRNAPNLSGAKPCPNCRAQIARDAALCVHCGYDFATGRTTRGPSRPWTRFLWIPLLGAGLFFFALNAVRRDRPGTAEPAAPPQPAGSKPMNLDRHSAPNVREIFEAKKVLAEETFRKQLDAQEPPYALNAPVELRRLNGLVERGTFSGYGGAGTNRVVLLATPAGEIGVPLAALDPSSRRRVDPDYREAFIGQVLSTTNPATTGDPTAQ